MFRVALADLTGRLPVMQVSDRLTDIAELIVERGDRRSPGSRMTQQYGVPMCGSDGAAAAGEDRGGRIRQARSARARLRVGSRSGVPARFARRGSAHRWRAAARQRHVFSAPRAADHSSAHPAFRGRPALRSRHAPAAQRQGWADGDADRCLPRLPEERKPGRGNTRRCCARARSRGPRRCAPLRRHSRRRAVPHVRRDTLREEVRKMRERMRAELSKARAGQFDLKQDPGGIADIEFLAQYWALKWADRYPPLVMFSDTIRQLESVASADLVAGDGGSADAASIAPIASSCITASLENQPPVVDEQASSSAERRRVMRSGKRRCRRCDPLILRSQSCPAGSRTQRVVARRTRPGR